MMRVWEWLQRHDGVLTFLFLLSIGSALLTAILLPLVVVRLPADYFTREPGSRSAHPRTMANIAWHILKNLLGVVFLIAGIAMLVLPGQGLLTMLIGILLMDLPGKYRLERWLVSRQAIHRSIDKLRTRFGQPPLLKVEQADRSAQPPPRQ